MGFFGGGSTTVVASSIYNLAGDINDRPNFLKSSVLAAVIGDGEASVGDAVLSAYQGGPGMSLRTFYRWAAGTNSGYSDAVGFTSGSLVTGNSIDTDSLADQILATLGAPDGYSVSIQETDLGYADISWWAEQYILENHPTLIDTNWHCDYLNGLGAITWADGSTAAFSPAGFVADARFLFATYTLNSGTVAGTLVQGSQVTLAATGAFPDTSGWTLTSNTLTPVTLVLSNVTTSGINTQTVYEKTTYMGIDPVNPARTYSVRQVMTQVQSIAAVGGVPVTTRWYRLDTQQITDSTRSGLQVFIYALGFGNATLDAMFNAPSTMGNFFPYIPIRIDNQMVSDTYKPDVYAAAKKAYYKATAKQFDDLVDKINDNSSIGDIDYAYVVFGVSVNVAEVTAKQYIRSFFESITESTSFTPHAYRQFKTQWAAAEASQEAYNAWVLANGGSASNSASQPALLAYPTLPTQSIEIKTSSTSNINFDMVISWNGIETSFGAGMKDSSHAVGDLWWVINGADTFSKTVRTSQDPDTAAVQTSYQVANATLYWQVDDNNWKAVTVYGLVHRNYIYGGKSVDIALTDAINDTEESGFIIPLHEGIFAAMSLPDSTQMATACTYLVFNCYQVVKKKWYQTGIFQIVMIVIIIIITYFTFGTGTGPATAVYGSIGAAIGLSGVAAIVAGFAITMVAAMIVSKIIGYVSKKIFGDKVGAIVGAIATVVVMVVGGSMLNGATWTTSLSQLTSPSTLLQLTEAVGKGVSEYIGAETQDVIKQTTELLDQYNTEMKSVSDKYASVIGTDMATFDPMELTDSASLSGSDGMGYTYETPDSFLNRTLMTGSDIAELNTALITEFTSLTLDISQNLVT
jgi:flavodoxin